MKVEKIKKGCGIAIIILTLIIIGFIWMVKTAFGPTHRTIEISSSLGKLICEEEYNADFAAVFYDVDFKLENGENEIINLGKLYFNREDWQKLFELNENKKWYYLSSNHSNIYNLILTDKISKEKLSFDLQSSQPKNDELWRKEKHSLLLPYSTTFEIDSIKPNSLYIKYKYTNSKNSKLIKSQAVEFEIDKFNKSLRIIKKTELE